MSIKIMTMVWDRYPNGGGELLMALALADHSHDDGQHIFPGVKSLMAKTRQSERTVQNQLRAMIEACWLLPTNKATGGAGHKREFRINPDWIKGAEFETLKKGANSAPFEKGANGDTGKGATDDEKGAIDDAKRVQSTTPTNNRSRTVKEPSENQSSGGAKPAASRSGKGARLDPEWKLPKKWGDWALARYPHWTAEYVRDTVALLFRNFWCAKSGKDATKVDWEGTWQNWCIKSEEISPFKNPAMPLASGATAGQWWKSSAGIEAKGKEHGIVLLENENFALFKQRVFMAAGDGPWMDAEANSFVRGPSAPLGTPGVEVKGNLKDFLKKLPAAPQGPSQPGAEAA
ncbi:MAG TPA: helix-turn-helix domain-containing protein [Noviherbaspirillum sp.]